MLTMKYLAVYFQKFCPFQSGKKKKSVGLPPFGLDSLLVVPRGSLVVPLVVLLLRLAPSQTPWGNPHQTAGVPECGQLVNPRSSVLPKSSLSPDPNNSRLLGLYGRWPLNFCWAHGLPIGFEHLVNKKRADTILGQHWRTRLREGFVGGSGCHGAGGGRAARCGTRWPSPSCRGALCPC